RAREKARGIQNLHFVRHDLHGRLPLPDACSDRVLCALVLDHIPDLAALFREMRRVCRQDGRIVISVMHPAMMLRGVTARFTDPATGRETRPESQSHQISDYVTAALGARLRLDHISEHAVDEALATRSARAARYLNWPVLLMMQLSPSVPETPPTPA